MDELRFFYEFSKRYALRQNYDEEFGGIIKFGI